MTADHYAAPQPQPIRVLVVDDSATARDLLVHVLNQDPAIQVVGVAVDGAQAVEAALRLRPDVITMDIHMPVADGYIATRRIMEACPTRIVIVTASSHAHEVAATFQAIEAGALAILARPLGPGHPDFDRATHALLQTVKLMSEVHVVRRWPKRVRAVPPVPPASPSGAEVRLVAIGASTGGPLVLQAILSQLPADFPVPLVIVQHIAAGFSAGFAEWLNSSTGFPALIAADGELLRPGRAYLAPDDRHLEVASNGTVRLSTAPPDGTLRPSVARLFHSVRAVYGAHAVGVLLTGMGRDGAAELKALRDAGAVTLVQDAQSAVVNGMPGEAVRLGAASHVLPPDEIAALLRRLVDVKESNHGNGR